LRYGSVGQKKVFSFVECSEILNSVLANLEIQIAETNTVVSADKLPMILADPVQMTQLFQNLIGNAIKFRKKEIPPRIEIKVEKHQSEWRFSFRDNGIGMDEKYKERVFVMFQRLNIRSEYEGTGIGLAICKKIVEMHGGKIWLNSDIGLGTTFHFTIPYV
ncbi:MAG: ATP-binding protein, partial [Bacteroidota bacterium]|nr:ATP-binding protein [Bacteroidota bacterium]